MKVLVIGANGQVGQYVVNQLHETPGVSVRAMVRKEEQQSALLKRGIDAVCVDLEEEVTSMTHAYKDIDAVIFTAGSGPNTGADKTMTIDLDGAIKTIEAAKQQGVKRYVMVSSFDTTRAAIQAAPENFKPYVVAKHYADDWLRRSGLDYTIIHPGRLTNEPAQGKVTIKETIEIGNIPRADVASVLVETVQNDRLIGREFQVISGDDTVMKGLKNL
ncbi:oxidoreductase [Halolactibacillus alkaliphilus]|uniref:Oxidoreductase n=1 Tax=Halolactibacillus alkaliphilus TaxID=442899 RepID=A0A511X0U3_9BACI|nr:SDR family oxidoreductase [Halolactibacillus alkaliphilus]GEN56564.1 oxidoreductase [Halolactibacillus alkaliphilus]GGN69249.1 oxidoreductase [Halolactibacillus alkaliphilus]SFO75230.1 NAD(P)H-binding [Halolactibacillus alkaliphilus]